MSRASRLLVGCLLAVSAAQAQGGLFQGLTVRFSGGLDHMSGLDDVNGQIRQMNTYFGIDGDWVQDAQGQDVSSGWAPYLKVPELNNRPNMGLTLEMAVLSSPYTRLTVGLEYAGGATAASNLFAFAPTAGFEASIFAEETVDVDHIMATCRYSLKDPNLPLFAHAGLGLGLGTIEAEGRYIQKQVSQFADDPMQGELVTQHAVYAEADGSALTARLFVGAEYELGNMSLMLDVGYNHMAFGELDGTTEEYFRDFNGDWELWQVTGAPDARYEFVPLISESLQRAVDNATAIARGLPVDESPIDLTGDAKALDYDLSGGFVRFSVGYRF